MSSSRCQWSLLLPCKGCWFAGKRVLQDIVQGFYSYIVECFLCKMVSLDCRLASVLYCCAFCVRWSLLIVVSLQYCIVVPFNKCFHVFAAAVTNRDSVSVE